MKIKSLTLKRITISDHLMQRKKELERGTWIFDAHRTCISHQTTSRTSVKHN